MTNMAEYPSNPPPQYQDISQYQTDVYETKYPGPQFCGNCGSPCSQLKFCSSCGAPINSLATLPNYQEVPTIITNQPQTQVNIFQADQRWSGTEDMSVVKGERLIYDFEKIACCAGQPTGLDQNVKHNVPSQLSSKGITENQWLEWMSELDEIQKIATTLCGCLIMFCFPGFIVQSLLCAICCPLSMNHSLSWLPCCYGDWYEALRQWMDKVNHILNKYGMHAKLTTYKPFSSAPITKLYSQRISGKDHNYEMSFLEIALTPIESDKLQKESWDHGVNDECTSGIGRCL